MQIANPRLGPGAMSALARGPWIQACRTVCCARGQLVASWLPLRIRCRAQHPHQGQEDQLGRGKSRSTHMRDQRTRLVQRQPRATAPACCKRHFGRAVKGGGSRRHSERAWVRTPQVSLFARGWGSSSPAGRRKQVLKLRLGCFRCCHTEGPEHQIAPKKNLCHACRTLCHCGPPLRGAGHWKCCKCYVLPCGATWTRGRPS